MLQALSSLVLILITGLALSHTRLSHNLYGKLVVCSLLFSEITLSMGNFEEKLLVLIILFLIVTKPNFLKGLDGCIAQSVASSRLYSTVFLIFTLYLIIQSIRTIIHNHGSIGFFYWPIYFILIFYSAFRAWSVNTIKHKLSVEELLKKCALINQSLGIILLSLLIYELIMLISFTIDTFDYFNYRVGNFYKSMLLFPVTLSLPMLFTFIILGKPKERFVSWIVILLAVILAALISSRATLIPLIFFTFFCLLVPRKGVPVNLLKKIIYITLALSITSVIVFVNKGVSQTILDTITTLEFIEKDKTEIRDLDRLLHLQAAIDISTENFNNFVFGKGYKMAGIYMAEPLNQLYKIYLPQLDFDIELGDANDVSTFGYSALLVDNGFVGVVLFISLIGLQCFIALRARSLLLWIVVLYTNFIFILRLYGNNFFTYPILYLYFLPGGYFSLQLAHFILNNQRYALLKKNI